jgi:hypothetical protein
MHSEASTEIEELPATSMAQPDNVMKITQQPTIYEPMRQQVVFP